MRNVTSDVEDDVSGHRGIEPELCAHGAHPVIKVAHGVLLRRSVGLAPTSAMPAMVIASAFEWHARKATI